ncbi:hypothetical protein LDVICp134 [lymphocystis disease virus-China]|uniref:Uncharacterized protein n=1 Tax=lymphocystis disease virus-China TaxID=256729 RepID=Q677X8_9VIRU|nr:hypothetical protein LDVICp134 [lymphocystis disease virus-China]AAU10979.1 hypothetical protein [lymphocystis disease virus-China]
MFNPISITCLLTLIILLIIMYEISIVCIHKAQSSHSLLTQHKTHILFLFFFDSLTLNPLTSKALLMILCIINNSVKLS